MRKEEFQEDEKANAWDIAITTTASGTSREQGSIAATPRTNVSVSDRTGPGARAHHQAELPGMAEVTLRADRQGVANVARQSRAAPEGYPRPLKDLAS
jgi:hypothetical protein